MVLCVMLGLLARFPTLFTDRHQFAGVVIPYSQQAAIRALVVAIIHCYALTLAQKAEGRILMVTFASVPP